MKTNNIQIISVEASEGFYLTQANLQEGEERVFSTLLYLGKDDSIDNWIEWSEEDKDKYILNLEAND